MTANPEFEADVRASFAAQGLMATLNARLDRVVPGDVAISAPISDAVAQQDGFAHAGLLWSLGDSAAGYAALSLMAPGERVLTMEMKINLMRPGVGDRVLAEGHVIREGRQVLTTATEVYALTGETRKHIATMLGTMMRIRP
ncbi:MAG: PaaI family thioesterase [Pseudomonadota bacterium]